MAWKGALTCTCGRPYILLKVDEVHTSKQKEMEPIAVYVRCPVHRRVRRLFLPYSRLTEWINAVGNRLFRCNLCGAEAKPKKAAIKGHFTIVVLECPTHGTQDNKRILWTPIYTAAKAVKEIQLAETSLMEDIFDETDLTSDGLVCPRCQTENDEDARFCAYCGLKFDV